MTGSDQLTRRELSPRLARGGRWRCTAGGGFTLLELVLALGLTMMLIATALVFFRQVLQMRSAMEGELARLAVTRTVFDRLTMELRSTYHDAGRDVGLVGEAAEMQMLVPALPEPAAWVADELASRPASSDLRWVTYRLAGGRLERVEQRQVVSAAGGATRSPSVTNLGEYVGFVHFRYWDGQTWQENWPVGPLPGAVEVRLGQEPLPEGTQAEDYPYPYQQRVIALAGVVAQAFQAPELMDAPAEGAAGGDEWPDEPWEELP